jgi:hypothetical protein
MLGVPEWKIRKRTRHRTAELVARYVRAAEAWTDSGFETNPNASCTYGARLRIPMASGLSVSLSSAIGTTGMQLLRPEMAVSASNRKMAATTTKATMRRNWVRSIA